MRQILQPSYVKAFRCTGSDCEDSCCKGWKITIDQETYKKYRALPQSDLKKRLNTSVKRSRANQSKEVYAKIILNEKKECPLLDEQGLCLVHKELGHECLSETCKVYPRNITALNGAIERSMTMSCPEVARQVLKNREVMTFEFVEDATVYNTKSYIYDIENSLNPIHQAFWDIRQFAIAVLQCRDYKLGERLIILAMALNKVDQCETVEAIKKVIDTTTQQIQNGDYVGCLEQIPRNLETQFRILSKWVRLKMGNTGIKSFEEIFSKVGVIFEGMEEDLKGTINKYNKVAEKYVLAVEAEYEHIFENYLVNTLFLNVFPADKPKALESLINILIRYSIMRIQLISFMYTQDTLTEDDIVNVIQVYAKAFEHARDLKKMMAEDFALTNGNTLPYAIMLIQ